MTHAWHDVTPGANLPGEFTAVVEIPMGSSVKYELDKPTGLLRVDRILYSAVYYPANYGFIPQTLAEDGDPCDVIVVGQVPVVPGAVIRCRPIGALMMRDEGGGDEKIVAVPVDKLHPFYSGVRSYRDLPPILTEQIAHFFQHYKDLEKGKWVTISKWEGPSGAAQLIRDGIARVQGIAVPPAARPRKRGRRQGRRR